MPGRVRSVIVLTIPSRTPTHLFHFLYNFKSKPTLVTLYILIGFIYAIALILFSKDPWGFGIIIGSMLAVGLTITFVVYRYIIKSFKTKSIFITETILTLIVGSVWISIYLPNYRHLIVDLRDYSGDYYVVLSGGGEPSAMDTEPSTFHINQVGVLHENYLVLNEHNYHASDTKVHYPTHWQLSEEETLRHEQFRQRTYPGHQAKQNLTSFGPYFVEIIHDDSFTYTARTLDSLATLIVYARERGVSLTEAREGLTTVWAELDYLYSTNLDPYVKISTKMDDTVYHEDGPLPPSDHGVHLSYTSYERIVEDLMRRAEQNQWPETTIHELIDYYSDRMPFGYYRLHIERSSEAEANSTRFHLDENRFLTTNPAQPHTVSGSTKWTNTMIFNEFEKQDSSFQITIYDRLRNDWDEDYPNIAFEPKIIFTFDLNPS